MKIAFIEISKDREYTCETTKQYSLGGIQTQTVHLSRELARDEGFEVVVFNNISAPIVSDGVLFTNTSTLREHASSIDAIVCTSYEGLVVDEDLQCVPRKIFWKHHNEPFIPVDKLPETLDGVDLFVCISDYVRQRYSKVYSSDKYEVIHYGMDFSCVPPRVERDNRESYITYISCPNRGLQNYAKILPLINKAVPELELHAYGAFTMYGDNWSNSDAEFRSKDPYMQLMGMSTFVQKEPVSYDELLGVSSKAVCMGYPGVFLESFGLAILHTMGTGTPVVASKVGSIGEVVGCDDYLIDIPDDDLGKAHTDWYSQLFANNVVELYEDRDKWESYSTLLEARAREFDIRIIAEGWKDVLRGL